MDPLKKLNLKKLLKKDINELEKLINDADDMILKATNNRIKYKLSIYKRALEIIVVSKKQNEELDLKKINELISSSPLFLSYNGRRHR